MRPVKSLLLFALCSGLALWCAGCAAPESGAASDSGRYFVFVGTYTGPKSKGIYRFRFDASTGALTPDGLAAETASPSFLALHPEGRFLYAVGELGTFAGQKSGSVSAFALDRVEGRLTPLNQQSSAGAGPCHLVVDRGGKNVLVANYGGGSAAVLPIRADGSLAEPGSSIQHTGSSVNPQRQKEPHAHSINLDPQGRRAFVADLGLDRVLVYEFDAARGRITPHDPPHAAVKPGAGPRHFAFHPSGRWAYVINELDSTVMAFAYDGERGVLRETQTLSTLPADFSGRSYTAEVQAHPSGKFLYGSNRGHDSIAVFAVDGSSGRLTFVECVPTRGKTPRNFGIDPSGRWLLAANQGSDTIAVFRIDSVSGRLQPTGEPVSAPVPVCVKFLAAP